jgi:hypothetical protein
VFEAAPEEETMIITSKVPVMAHLRKYLVAAAVILLLAAGAAAYHFWIKANGAPILPRTVPPALPSTGAPVVTRPLETAPAPVLPGAEDHDHIYHSYYYHASCAFINKHFAIVICPGRSKQGSDIAREEKNKHH